MKRDPRKNQEKDIRERERERERENSVLLCARTSSSDEIVKNHLYTKSLTFVHSLSI